MVPEFSRAQHLYELRQNLTNGKCRETAKNKVHCPHFQAQSGHVYTKKSPIERMRIKTSTVTVVFGLLFEKPRSTQKFRVDTVPQLTPLYVACSHEFFLDCVQKLCLELSLVLLLFYFLFKYIQLTGCL